MRRVLRLGLAIFCRTRECHKQDRFKIYIIDFFSAMNRFKCPLRQGVFHRDFRIHLFIHYCIQLLGGESLLKAALILFLSKLWRRISKRQKNRTPAKKMFETHCARRTPIEREVLSQKKRPRKIPSIRFVRFFSRRASNDEKNSRSESVIYTALRVRPWALDSRYALIGFPR